MTQWPYLDFWARYKNLRSLSFLQLLKFEKAKCHYFFDLWPWSRVRTISSFKGWGVRLELSSEEEIASISAPGPQFKNVRTLCFLKLQKLKKRKCPQFFGIRPWSRDMATISFFMYFPLMRPFDKGGILSRPFQSTQRADFLLVSSNLPQEWDKLRC